MADADAVSSDGTLAIREKAKLRRVLRRFDLVLFTACAIVGLDSVAAAAQAGPQAITWLGVSLVVFFIPYGMLTAELGSAFPVEGGPYAWVRMAFGRPAGAVTAVLYWLSNPIWLGGTLTATVIATLDSLVLPRPLGTTGEIAVSLAFIWVTVGTAVVAFRVGKWGPNLGTIVKIAVVGLFTALFVLFLLRHGRPDGAATAADLKPSLSGFATATGILVFLWAGFELSSGAAEEMRDPRRDVPVTIAAAGVIGALLYGLVIGGIVLVIPGRAMSGVTGFGAAYANVAATFHSYRLDVAFAVLVIAALVGSGSVWLQGADRTQAIAALDGAAPAWMGRFTSFGTPMAVNLVSGLVASAFGVLIFVIAQGSLARFFSVMLALAISTAALSYALIFPALIRLRRLHPDQRRPYRVPGGAAGAWLTVIVTELFVLVTAVTLLWPGALEAAFGRPYSVRATWGVSRAFFESVTLGSLGAVVALGLLLCAFGARARRRGLSGIAPPGG